MKSIQIDTKLFIIILFENAFIYSQNGNDDVLCLSKSHDFLWKSVATDVVEANETKQKNQSREQEVYVQ